MPDPNEIHHATTFDSSTSGVYHTGSGDVNVVVSNLGDAIAVIKRLIPKEETDAVERLIAALRSLGRYQKAVSELKSVHNMLHDLEGSLSTLELPMQSTDTSFLSMSVVQNTWRRSAHRQLQALQYFAANEMHIVQPPLVIAVTGVTGPPWAVQLVALQTDLEASLRERNVTGVCEIWVDMLQTCRDQLYFVDKQLLEAASKLDHLTDQILRTIGDDSNQP